MRDNFHNGSVDWLTQNCNSVKISGGRVQRQPAARMKVIQLVD